MHALLEFKDLQISQRTEFSKIKLNHSKNINNYYGSEMYEKNIKEFFQKNICDGAFEASYITSVVVPEGITTIPNDTFSYCKRLTNVILPYGLTDIGNSAFKECHIIDIAFPKSVLHIGDSAFCNCTLENIILPDELKSLGEYVFLGCYRLTSVIWRGKTYKRNDFDLLNKELYDLGIAKGIHTFDVIRKRKGD